MRRFMSPRRPALVRGLHLALATATLGLSATVISGLVAPGSAFADPATGPGVLNVTVAGAIAAGVVPDGTCSAVITATGGTGASSGLSTATGGAGGRGAQVKATFAVVPGQAYTGFVGGGGASSAAGAAGGVGGGGAGGKVVGGHQGGGGAGATTFAIAGQTLMVVGGGGGGGAAHVAPPAGTGGNAGVLTAPGVAPGSDGAAGVDNPATIIVSGGKGGAAATGGAGATNTGGATNNGAPGGGIGVGNGGNGGPDTSFDSSGGGGAGYTGGGGGASTVADSVAGSGGGGGSSFLAATSPNLAATPVSAVSGALIPAVAPTATAATGPNGSLNVDWIPCTYDLALTKSVSTPDIGRGSTVTWTVSITNNGPNAMTKGDTIDLTDTLPLGPNGPASPAFKVLSIDVTGGSNAAFNSGAVTCTGVAVGVAMPAATNCSRPYAPLASTPGSPTGGNRGLDVGETLTITYEQQISVTATCPVTITNTAALKDRPTVSGTTDIVGVITANTASKPLNILCDPPKLKLVKALSGLRFSSTDQFTMAISPGGSAPSGSTATTAGTGSTINANSGVVTVASATAGSVYNFSEAMAAGSASTLSQYGSSVTCVNAKAGSATVLPAAGSTAVPFSIRPASSDDITCTLTNKPLPSSLKIDKKTTATGFTALGATIPYTFTVTNDGQTTLGSITITDPNASGITCDVTTLAPTAIANCTGTHTITQADLDAGKVVNTASVTGTPPGGSPIPSVNSVTVTVNGTQTPKLTIVKSTTATNYSTVGETIPYSFVVKNDGNVTLTTIAVSDPKTTGVSCVATALAPGQLTNCSGSRTVTQADINAGSVVNTASVTGKTPAGTTTTPVNSNPITVAAVQTPELTIAKVSTLSSFSTLNSTVPYTFTVTNTGNVTMTAIVVSDLNTGPIACPLTALNPGVSTICTGSHIVTQTDLDSGTITNTASVVGTPPSGTQIAPVTSNTVKVLSANAPQITITKSSTATLTGYSVLGATVPYSFVVKNTGNVSLFSIVVSDPKLSSVSCLVNTLAPNVSTTCSGNRTVTQADLDLGSITNTASVTAKTAGGSSVPPVPSNKVVVPANQTPTLTVKKLTTQVSFSAVGQSIPYTFEVENTGNVTMTDIAVTDPKTGTIICPQTTLIPGDIVVCTGTHSVTQADLDFGSIVNQASVGGTPPSGTPIAPINSNVVTTPAVASPSLTIVKASSTPSFSALDDAIDYTFKVTNSGNITINSIVVTDPLVSGITCPDSLLAPGASTTCTGSRAATASDITATKVVNTASVGGNTPGNVALPAVDSNTITVPLKPLPDVKIVKSADKTSVGSITDVITYKFLVTNTGNVAISAVTVTDAHATGITCDLAVLAIGETATCFGTHAVTATDLNAGSVINTASVDAIPDSGPAIPTTDSNTITIPATQTPKLAITKQTTATQYDTVGQTISFDFVVENKGNVTINSIAVTDGNATGISCPITTLKIGESTTCTGIHTVTQSDLDAGAIINQAKVGGTPPSGAPLVPVDSNIKTVPATQTAKLKITKGTTTQTVVAVGETIPYTFQVTNIGNVSVTDMTIDDPNAAGISCSVSSLAPGVGTTCSGTHTVSQADLDAGKIVNTATVVATPPSGIPTAPFTSNTITVAATQLPKMTISKATPNPSYSAVGEIVPYTFFVQNTGNVTLTSVTVTDLNASGITCVLTTLAPGESTNCNGNHEVTQLDLDGGAIINTAQISGTPPIGNPIPPVDSNTIAIPATQSPQLTIVKSTAKPSYSSVGELINYNFLVENTGNVSISAIAVSDPITGAVTCSPISLAPGKSVICTASRAATQDDIDAGAIINSASVTGKSADGSTLAPIGSNFVTVPATQKPTITVEKSSTTTDYAAVGDTIEYSFIVTNRGNVTLSNVSVTDPVVTGLACLADKLAPGANTTCTGTHTVTQTDIDSGKIINTAQVSAVKPNGTLLSPVDSNTVIVPAIQTPKLTIDKQSTTPSYASVDDSINYTFTVTNAGNVTMTSVSISDPIVAGISCPSTSLAPGASITCNGTHKVSQTDLDGGTVVNVASVSATPPSGTPIAPVKSATVTVPAQQNPQLTVIKGALSSSYSSINETITFTFTITNSGNVTMKNVGLSDPAVNGLGCSTTVLAPGFSATCTAQRIVSAADLDGGSITNTASAVGTPPSGIAIAPVPSNTVVIPAVQSPSLTVVKVALAGNYNNAGDVVPYQFRVTNTGNVTMTSITIMDTKVGTIVCTPTSLKSGEQAVCVGSHLVTQADVDGGSVVNTASVVGTPPSGTPIAPVPSNTVTIPAIYAPGLSIVKSSATTAFNQPGQQVTYDFLVKNIGNVTINNVAVVDPQTSGVACLAPTLAVGISTTCSGIHTVTQAELDLGYIDNTATVSGTDPTGEPIGPLPSNTVSLPAAVNALLDVQKRYTGTGITHAGDVAAYEFTVTNKGNVTMTLVEVHDAKLYSLSCGASTLAPDEATTCTGLHDVTQAEADAAVVVNTGYVTGKPPVGSPLAPKPSNEVRVPIVPASKITVVKASSAQPYSKVGDVLDYTFEVTNEGNTTLTQIVVNDPLVSGLGCLAGSLAPGEKTTCSGSHSVTQVDLDAGSVINTSSVSATEPSGSTTVPSPSNPVTIPGIRTPGILIAKTTTLSSVAVVGTNIPYFFEVTNSGNVTLTNVAVNDTNVTGGAATCPSTSLAPGASMVCTAKHPVTLADLNSGSILNTAQVAGTPPGGAPALLPVDSNTVTVPVVQGPNLSISKLPDLPIFGSVGQVVPYTFTVTNSGNVTMTNIAVADAKTGPVVCDATTLIPTIVTICHATHVVTQADLDAGKIVNTATVTGTSPKGVDLSPVSSNTVSIPAVASPLLSVSKDTTKTSVSFVGETIPYVFTVSNDGNVSVSNIGVVDPKVSGSVLCPLISLAPGETMDCTGSHFATQADLDLGHVDNTASVAGKAPSGVDLPSVNSNTIIVPVTQSPELSILKSSAAAAFNVVGQAIPYTFTVANIGNVTVTAVEVTDPNAGAIICPQTVLAPGASTICSGNHIVTQIDLDAGAVVNTAQASAIPPSGIPFTPATSNTVTMPAAQGPAVTIIKAANSTPIRAAGETIGYTFTVTNTGNVTVKAVAVADPIIGTIACPATTLDPGASTICTGAYVTTQADVDTGKVVNVATVSATLPNGVKLPSVPSNEVVVPVLSGPGLSIVKSATNVAVNPGLDDKITYEFLVTNNGNVTMKNIAVTDAKTGAVTCPVTTLLPGQSTTCTASLTVTKDDVAAGVIVNTATVTGLDPTGSVLPPVSSNEVRVPTRPALVAVAPAPPTTELVFVDPTVPVSIAPTSFTATAPGSTIVAPAVLKPGIKLDKSAPSSFGALGDVVPYVFKITNTGNTTLTNVTLDDPMPGLTNPDCGSFTGTLVAGASVTCTANYTVTANDLKRGSISNTASVSGVDPAGNRTTKVLGQSTAQTAFESPGKLSFTGAASREMLAAAFGLIAAGALLLGLRRRRV
jgi:uncharacterized repeat protein (TIGR01451 family)